MLLLLLALLSALALLPAAAAAEELRLGLRVSQDWDSNVFNAPEGDEFEDFSLRVTPRMALEDRTGDLQWLLEYDPSFRTYYRSSGIDGWDHRVNLTADWRIAPRTTLTLTERFARLQNVNSLNELVVADDPTSPTELAFQRNRYMRNDVGLELVHALSPGQSLVLTLNYLIQDYSENSSDVRTFSSRGIYNLYGTERDVFGLGVAFVRQHFTGTDARPSSNTNFYNAFGVWEHRFDPTLFVTLSAGPTWIDADDPPDPPTTFPATREFPLVREGEDVRFVESASCPEDGGVEILVVNLNQAGCRGFGTPLDRDQQLVVTSQSTGPLALIGDVSSVSNTSLTFFANAEITKNWDRWSLRASYQRRATASSGIGTSEIADIVRSALSWQPTRRWRLGLSGAFTRRTQATEGRVNAEAVDGLGADQTIPGFVVIEDGVPRLLPDVTVPAGAAQVIGRRSVTLDNDLEILQYAAEFNASYQLQEHLSLFGRLYYYTQRPSGDVQITQDRDDVRVDVGFSYWFDPIRF